MKSHFTNAVLAFLALASVASAQQMSYQGRLTDNSGAPVAGPQAALTFSVWDSPTGGTKVWGDFQINADLIDGRFSVKLGPNDSALRPLAGSFGGNRYIQVQVASDVPLPRQEVLPAPSALSATNAGNIVANDRKLTIRSTGSPGYGNSGSFNFDSGSSGLLLETFNLADSAGLFLNGTTAVLYSPGDNGVILSVYDEDRLGDASPIPAFQVLNADGGISTLGGGFFGGALNGTSGTLRVGGRTRMGSETGTSQAPSNPGLVIRRISSTSAPISHIVAKTEMMNLERDGTPGGFRARFTATGGTYTIAGTGINQNGSAVHVYLTSNTPAVGSTVQIFTTGERIGHFQLTFGDVGNGFGVTQVTLMRFVNAANDLSAWHGTLTSNVDQ